MDLEDARLSASVLVRSDYREPHRQRSVDTIKKCYQVPDYEAFEVLFSDGNRELFWDHQL